VKTKIITLDQIKASLNEVDYTILLKTIEDGFVAYSSGRAVTPPVGHLAFKYPPADVHIKYGYIEGDEYYVLKVASGFYDNPKLGLSSSNGVMLVFSQKTGELLGVLLDEGYLTDIRTALAGAIAAKYLAPTHIEAIGIVGTGTQARLQLQYLKDITSCRKVYIWGRSEKSLDAYIKDMSMQGFSITSTQDMQELTRSCNLIITTTPSTQPLIRTDWIKSGTHITAIGADAKGKQELDPLLLQRADMVVADSKSQCMDHGEVAAAIEQGLLSSDEIVELGELIKSNRHREGDSQITVADLTGVATQDIQIAKLLYNLTYGVLIRFGKHHRALVFLHRYDIIKELLTRLMHDISIQTDSRGGNL
jgi:ornithine cyclodeaminase